MKFDLRKYYDICELEVSYHQFRADILLSSSTNVNRPPILMEIKVTHKCTQEKLKEGVRIIEIPVFSELHIDSIVESCSINGIRRNTADNNGKDQISLYNFDKIEKFNPLNLTDDIYNILPKTLVHVFILDRVGKFYSFKCHCYEVDKKVSDNVHYYVANIATSYKEILQGFSKRGVKVRNCFLCKFSRKTYFDERICVLYKKFNLPKKPLPEFALTCEHYVEDNYILFDDAYKNYDETYAFRSYYYICQSIL